MTTYTCIHCNKESEIRKYQQKNKYCSNKCQAEYQANLKLEKWLRTGVIDAKISPTWLKRYILEKQGHSCDICKITEWNGKVIVFELEHKDGNSENNAEDNLCCLCPNCHSQTMSYKGRNMGNGRHLR